MKKLLLFVMMLFLVCGCSKNSDELVMVTEAGFAPYEYYRDGEITSDSYGMIVKKGNKELLLAINKVIDRLKSEGKIDEFVLNHTEE